MLKDKMVTVCITTFNRKEMLNRAVESVLNQTYANLELIIVDDCSSDGTEDYVHHLLDQDRRIRYIRHEKNQGLAAARNTAIFNSQGTYFTFVDDDDSWKPNYLEEFVKLAGHYDENWCFCCGSITIDSLGQTVYANYQSLEGPLIDYVQQGYTPPVASQFYFTSTLQRYGGYNEQVKNGVDHDLWLTLAFQGINIKSSDEYLSLPSEAIDISRVKMTNSYQKRINGITNSLSLWKPQLVAHFGEGYYRKFYDAYLLREKKKFFRLYMLKLNFVKAASIYREVDVSAKEVVKSLAIALLYRFGIPIKREKYVTRGTSLAINLATVAV
ncbi:glycosyltransferase family 2 protein [Tunicatimonas pelagia]|uniref:glycosyltransferase family 2 protein n=1 Tax=Tunicatimonas pelagia TaxID=931531 RepID=UPI0026661462|nr:glycosyltransferase family 2 protein [Tunicatimonas pelagia]WKN40863.1 glycosyltransferase family 2 protein [Tunicatimonas pelagia]